MPVTGSVGDTGDGQIGVGPWVSRARDGATALFVCIMMDPTVAGILALVNVSWSITS